MNIHRLVLLTTVLVNTLLHADTIYLVGHDLPGCFDGDQYTQYFGHTVNSNRDQVKERFARFKQVLNGLGHTIIQIWSLNDAHNADFIVCFDLPINEMELLKNFPKEKLILFLWEPPIIKPYNYDRAHHVHFSKIYTLFDDYVTHHGFGKFFESQPTFEFVGDSVPFESRKLCTMLAGHRSSQGPNELYSKRKAFVEFCEEYAPHDFEFYGPGWPSQYKTYRGYADSKLETYKQYKFALCYENTKDLEGYITSEKILFCFIAGCVPVYWGPRNIGCYIPEDCFIHGNRFKDPYELYTHLKNMSEETYYQYIANIKDYLQSDKAFLFSNDNFADILVSSMYPKYDRASIFDAQTCRKLEKYKGWRALY